MANLDSDIDQLSEYSSDEDNYASIRLDDPDCTNLDSTLKKPVQKLKKKPLSKRSVKRHKAEEAMTKNQETTSEPAPLEISGHLWLETTGTTTVPAPSCARSGKVKVITTVDAAQCPVLIFTTNMTFNKLLNAIARLANVPVTQLTIARLFWKHETPAKGEHKLLADEVSYKAMLKSVQAKKGNPIIFFYLPKLIANEEPPISTVRSVQVAAEHNEITSRTRVMDSIKGQIDAMCNSYASQHLSLSSCIQSEITHSSQ
ncbi:hypothetical protein JVT61DRAFT_14424 [Boletus reticuloceps]|uniref:Ubiquitin-like domain-containing protein n=1 Tax=Boletus reticuloceps TaxID=495285 RepID=A0A8I2YRD3_9AGAM|nr:hypothetical protein JVT61DRAFT_14424 [Boletus reticuloceps]